MAVLPVSLLRNTVLNGPDSAPPGETPSAVLIPLVSLADGQTGVFLTERAAELRHHGGQISFPGGRIDEGETVIETALREAQEEIALDQNQVEIIGHLPGVVTTLGFHIAPVLAWINADFTPVPAPAEVARVLIEPLAPLLDSSNHVSVMREARGQAYQSWTIRHDHEFIWGATARILVQWSALLKAGSEPSAELSKGGTGERKS